MSGLLVLGRRSVLGADAFTPQQRAGSPEMTPAQLADLDRRLSPAEQKRVDAFQVGEADALQKKEESTPYVDSKTGEKRVAVVTYEPGGNAPRHASQSAPAQPAPAPAPTSPPAAALVESVPTWEKILFALLAGGAALVVGLSLRRTR